jgi:hypothetical protein
MPKSDNLFKLLLQYDQRDLPALSKEIDNGHPTANTKDRLRDLHKIITVLVRYTILDNAEKHNLNVDALMPQSAVGAGQASARLSAQHHPATDAMSLGAPAMPGRQINVIVGAEAQPPMPSGLDQEPDPEPTDRIQIITKRNGMTTVIPPMGSRAPVRTFAAGQGVDATYVSKIDAGEEA